MKILKTLIPLFLFSLLLSCVSSADTKYQSASKLREKANKYNLKKYVEKDYQDAETDYQQAKNYMDSKQNFKADKLLDQVNKKFQIVLDKGFPPCTDDKNKNANDKKKIATDIKANVAVKDLYDDAEKSYGEAVKYKEAKNYENAIDTFEKADEKYSTAYSKAKEKKDKAEKSITQTQDAFKELDKNSAELKKQMEELNKSKSN